MNYITKLKGNQQATKEWIEQFKALLSSPKFQGTERVCQSCGRIQQGRELQCQSLVAARLCRGGFADVRKDWISTSDVLRWLETLEGQLQ